MPRQGKPIQVYLDDELRERMEAAARVSGRKLSQEARRAFLLYLADPENLRKTMGEVGEVEEAEEVEEEEQQPKPKRGPGRPRKGEGK